MLQPFVVVHLLPDRISVHYYLVFNLHSLRIIIMQVIINQQPSTNAFTPSHNVPKNICTGGTPFWTTANSACISHGRYALRNRVAALSFHSYRSWEGIWSTTCPWTWLSSISESHRVWLYWFCWIWSFGRNKVADWATRMRRLGWWEYRCA